MDSDYRNCVEELKALREKFNWVVEENFIRELYLQIRDWKRQISNEKFNDFFRQQLQQEEIDWLLREDARHGNFYRPIIGCALETNYKDNSDLYEDGKPLQRRTTPVHLMARLECYRSHLKWSTEVGYLFSIYDRFDVNYTDELGFTHFHAACKFNIVEAASQFLELGQDPNLIVPRTLDSPLHLTTSPEVVELLLEKGADPNQANAKGSTPLHNMCQLTVINRKELIEKFFEINKKIGQHHVQIDVQDELGNAPLHLAAQVEKVGAMEILLNNGADPNLRSRENRMTPLHFICKKIDVSLSRNTKKIPMAELLLRVGADPNVELEGSTPLHLICKIFHDFKLLKKIFECSRLPVNVNALDSQGRTPLFYAVVTLAPQLVDVLLDNGADLSSFTFPTVADFKENSELWIRETSYKLLLASGIMAIVESLIEKRGYKLCEEGENNRTIGKLFARHGLFQASSDSDIRLKRGKCWFEEDAFVEKAKKIKFTADLSLHEVIQLRPEVANKTLDYLDYFKFAKSNDLYKVEKRYSCGLHLCEKLARVHFLESALEVFPRLFPIYNILPHICEMILDPLTNKDLWHIYEAWQQQIEIDRQNNPSS